MTTNMNIQAPLFLPPVSSSQADETSRGLVTLNLDEIFGDCFFTPDGETVFLSETADPDAILPSGETQPAPVASRPVPSSLPQEQQQQQQEQQVAFVPFLQAEGSPQRVYKIQMLVLQLWDMLQPLRRTRVYHQPILIRILQLWVLQSHT